MLLAKEYIVSYSDDSFFLEPRVIERELNLSDTFENMVEYLSFKSYVSDVSVSSSIGGKKLHPDTIEINNSGSKITFFILLL